MIGHVPGSRFDGWPPRAIVILGSWDLDRQKLANATSRPQRDGVLVQMPPRLVDQHARVDDGEKARADGHNGANTSSYRPSTSRFDAPRPSVTASPDRRAGWAGAPNSRSVHTTTAYAKNTACSANACRSRPGMYSNRSGVRRTGKAFRYGGWNLHRERIGTPGPDWRHIMARRPIVLIHGYSASGSAFDAWKAVLKRNGYEASDLHVITYKSLTNEVTIDDIAEGFDRALKSQIGLDKGEAFDVIVHSTGMLVIRAWLTKFADRRRRLRHLIALAPATFGSPLAHKGRGYLGAAVKGNRTKGPDFREAGDLVLDGLELGSRYTWDLAHQDLLGDEPRYDATEGTPYVFTFCGTEKYEGLAGFANEPGTDGTVRLAGCALNTRKILLDLTRPQDETTEERATVAQWSNADIPLVPVRGLNHGTIMSEPSPELVGLVVQALDVKDADAFESWQTRAKKHTDEALASEKSIGRWQQLVCRVLDDREDPVRDYVIEFIVKDEDGTWASLSQTVPSLVSVHTFARDPSLRCFHINLEHADILDRDIGLRLIASSGTELVAYRGYSQPGLDVTGEGSGDLWSATIDLTHLRNQYSNQEVRFFHPFTTTLVEIHLDREPMPLDGFNDLSYFPDAPERRAQQKTMEVAAALRQQDWDEARLNELMALLEQQKGRATRD